MADSRITTTSTRQYDMLLAISQESVNAAIENTWDIEGDNLEDLEYDAGVFGSLAAKVSGVRVQILADGTGRGAVLVRLTFASRAAQFVDKKAKKGKPIDMTKWMFCFQADIGLNDIHKAVASDEAKLAKRILAPHKLALQAAKTRLAANVAALAEFGKRAGDYSILRLFVDFTNANYSAFKEEDCWLPGLSAELKPGYSKLIGDWLAENKTEDKSVIGYGLAVDKPDVATKLKVADCLIPTTLILNTYGYKATPQSPVAIGWTGDSNRNCIVYSDMTEGRKVSGERMLRWSRNFTSGAMTDKERRIDGSYNDDMQIVPDEMKFNRDGNAGQRRYHWTFRATLGYNQAHPDWKDSYFDFTENEKAATFSKIQSNSSLGWAKQKGFDDVSRTTGVSWSWSKDIQLKPNDINEDWHFPEHIVNWTDHLGGSQSATSHVDVVPVPGSGLTKLRRLSTTEVKMNGYYTRLTDDNLDYKAHYKVTCFWQVDYQIV